MMHPKALGSRHGSTQTTVLIVAAVVCGLVVGVICLVAGLGFFYWRSSTPAVSPESNPVLAISDQSTPVPDPAPPDEATRAITNLLHLPVEDGISLLRQRAETQYKAVLREMEQQLKEAQERLTAAQSNKSAADKLVLSPEQQATLLEFRKVQEEQKSKLDRIRRELQAQIRALERSKGVTNAPAQNQ